MRKLIDLEKKESNFIEKWILEQKKLGGKKINLDKFPISSLNYGSWESYAKHKINLKTKYEKNPDKFKKLSSKNRIKYHKRILIKGKEYRDMHKEQAKIDHKNWRKENKDYIKEHKRLSWKELKSNPKKILEYHKKRKIERQELKYKILLHYSKNRSKIPNCTCCGENGLVFLTIDHINGRGSEHRKKWGRAMYRWLSIRNFPKGYRTLCFNCNIARAFTKTKECPHKLL